MTNRQTDRYIDYQTNRQIYIDYQTHNKQTERQRDREKVVSLSDNNSYFTKTTFTVKTGKVKDEKRTFKIFLLHP